jgi:hypothetical protein
MLAFASMKNVNKKSKAGRGGAKTAEPSAQRGLRWPKSLDSRVEKAATEKGFRSPQEYIISVVIEKLEAEAQPA